MQDLAARHETILKEKRQTK